MAGPLQVYCAHDALEDPALLVPHPQNPNTHPAPQISLLAKLIGAHGWRAPITVSTRSGFVVRGHGRILAAQELGVAQVPVDYQAYENEAMEWADLLADNQIPELAELDRTKARDLLMELDTGAFDLDLTGFDYSSLEELMTAAPPPGAGEAPYGVTSTEQDGQGVSSPWSTVQKTARTIVVFADHEISLDGGLVERTITHLNKQLEERGHSWAETFEGLLRAALGE